MDTKRQLLDISRRPENRTCIDCGASSPQWANTNHSIFFCLECSGIHRSLGVHHSFVRSITMDTWSNDQVTRLSIGGNQKCLDFFNTYHNVGSIHDKVF